jgi:extracellular elastinolytic metalloproteinase
MVANHVCATDNIARSQPSVDKKDAIAVVEAALNCAYNSHPITTHYLANSDGSVSLVYAIEVKNDETGEWYEAHVDAHSGKLLSTVDYVADVTVRRP